MSDSYYVKIYSIMALTVICLFALAHGIDGFLLSVISAIIGGISGYEIGKGKKLVEEITNIIKNNESE